MTRFLDTLFADSNDIMDYVLVRASPVHPGLPRPRFSLYLSSQLQFGVIIVYHQQCVILLGKGWFSTDGAAQLTQGSTERGPSVTLTGICPSR